MISKEEFIEIIDRLEATDNTIEQINDILRNCRDTVETDFTEGSSLMVCHKDLVIQLLDNMFDTDDVSWWIYELDYGKEFEIGCITLFDDKLNEVNPDLSTSEKLYDYLIEQINKKNNKKI